MKLKTINIFVFGIVGLIVLGSWGMTIWTFLNIPMATGAMILASCLCTYSYISFITNSLRKQKFQGMLENGVEKTKEI